jgi:ABC-type multidrug transport system ATPase subunit
VEIARALASQPKFILLDEPFAGVDPIAVGEIQRIVRFLRDRQIGVLITDHNVRETLGICDHAYIISEGSVLAEGQPDQIIENDAVRSSVSRRKLQDVIPQACAKRRASIRISHKKFIPLLDFGKFADTLEVHALLLKNSSNFTGACCAPQVLPCAGFDIRSC